MSDARNSKWDMPPVFHRFYVLTGWLLDRVEKLPKSVRFTFGQRITDTALDIVEKIVRAAYGRRRSDNLEAANTQLEVLRVLLRLCHDRRYISQDQYSYVTGELLEIGKMIGGWMKDAGK
jgi:four helix bundle protein